MNGNGDDLKRDGIDKVSNGNEGLLLQLQWIITQTIKQKGDCTSDDVYAAYGKLPVGVNPNIMGAAFNTHPSIRKLGYTQSTRPEAHRRMIAVWTRQ